MSNQHGIEQVTRVAERFEVVDLGAPFKVILHNSVKITLDKDGEVDSYFIPDYVGLERAVAWARLLHPRKLSGKELKFVRKLVNVSQQDFARTVLLSVEHVSKVENGHSVLSPSSEKLARLFLFKSAAKLRKLKSQEARNRLEKGIDSIFEGLVPVPACSADDELCFSFVCEQSSQQAGDNANDNQDLWDNEPILING